MDDKCPHPYRVHAWGLLFPEEKEHAYSCANCRPHLPIRARLRSWKGESSAHIFKWYFFLALTAGILGASVEFELGQAKVALLAGVLWILVWVSLVWQPWRAV
jgi:hypothetical protein